MNDNDLRGILITIAVIPVCIISPGFSAFIGILCLGLFFLFVFCGEYRKEDIKLSLIKDYAGLFTIACACSLFFFGQIFTPFAIIMMIIAGSIFHPQ